MAFKIFLCSHFMLNTQFLTPLSKKKKRKERKGKKEKVKVLSRSNMEEYLLHMSEKNV